MSCVGGLRELLLLSLDHLVPLTPGVACQPSPNAEPERPGTWHQFLSR